MADHPSEEARELEPDGDIEAARRAHEELVRFVEQTHPLAATDARAAVQLAAIVNGGASVSLLAFAGGLVAQGRVDVARLQGIASGIAVFAIGVGLALLCAMLSYLTNYFIGEAARARARTSTYPYWSATSGSMRGERIATALHALSLACALGSFGAFLGGVYVIYHAIIGLAAH